MNIPNVAHEAVEKHPHELIFASLSGAHLYGFPSVDSDIDIRGAHLLPLSDVVGMTEPKETHEWEGWVDGIELDIVTYDLKKFVKLIAKKNGNVLEQLVSPLVMTTTESHDRLREIALESICANHAHHYRGMARNRLKAFREDCKLKSALYAFRAALTGRFAMDGHGIEPNLVNLAQHYGLDFLNPLIEEKRTAERGTMSPEDAVTLATDIENVLGSLEEAFETTALPDDVPAAREKMDAFLIEHRLRQR